ncbi:MAG: FAD binding domain-containing protein [Rhodobacterales bacterium]|nr:FAD binding domain-containing protein [Rhodobacterales bacterium]
MARYFVAHTLEEALDVRTQGAAEIVAGGSDYFPAKSHNKPQGDILDVTRIAGFSDINETNEGWRIGAAVSFSALITAPFPPAFDGLKQAARQIGSVQIQNVATLVGNICNASPAADSVPVLLSMGAEIEIMSRNGPRQMPLGDFITGVRKTALMPGEIVTAVLIPKMPESVQSAFEKLGSRAYLVISIAMVAVLVEVAEGRISMLRVAVGACSPIAVRLVELEGELIGKPIADLDRFSVTAAHLAALSPMDDLRGSANYRLEAVAEITLRALRRAAHA